MNEQRSWTVPKIIYAVLLSFLLLGYMIIIATYKDYTATGQTYSLPILFWIFRIITAVLAIGLGKLWKDKCFLILMAYLLLKAVRVAIDNPANLFDQGVSESLLTGLWVFSACYGLARILEKDQLKRFLSINVFIWTVGMVANSCLGIYAAWIGGLIYNIGRGSYWGVYQGRLFLCYYETTSASVLSISAVIAFSYAFIAKKTIKTFYILSVLPMIIALCLTDSRGPQVSMAAGIGSVVGIAVLHYFQTKSHQVTSKRWIPWITVIIVSCAVFFTTLLLCRGTISLFNQVRTTGFIPRASAEAVNTTAWLSNRGFTGNDLLTGRPLIWEATLKVLGSSKKTLLIGTSIYQPMTQVNDLAIFWDTASHAHCMPLMILLENGIIGFVLIGVFFIILAVRSFRMITDKENNQALFILPVIISVAVGELVECFTWLRSGQAPVLPFFFVAIGVIMAAHKKVKA